MSATNRGKRAMTIDAHRLRRMIGPDDHRPGPAHARLRAEQIPVWAIVGYASALANSAEPAAFTEDVISQVAEAYDVSRDAVQAALLYYDEQRSAIDVLLAANAAAVA